MSEAGDAPPGSVSILAGRGPAGPFREHLISNWLRHFNHEVGICSVHHSVILTLAFNWKIIQWDH